MKIKDYTLEIDALAKALNSEKLRKNHLGRCEISSAAVKGQYNGLKWYRCLFKADTINRLKPEYKDVVGIHIMPYRIRTENLIGIVSSNKNEHAFNEQSDTFSDYDPDTGNIHICPNDEWQIVLIKKNKSGYGPGWADENIESFELNDMSLIQKFKIKTDYYFPRIDTKENDLSVYTRKLSVHCKIEELIEFIKDVIKEMTVNP